jgi:hypothetical protein
MAPAAWSRELSAASPAQQEDHADASALTQEAPFLAENAAAMEKMMADMDVKPTGNVDADFVATMIPHHQGAIDMALAVLRYGKNEQIRRIAQEIIVEQQQEIAAMRLALGQPLPPSAPAPTQPSTPMTGTSAPAVAHDHSTMSHGAMPTSPAMQMKQESNR